MSRLPQPLRPLGAVKSRSLQHQKESRLAVMIRCKGRCEGCGNFSPKLEYAHIFGRRNIVGEPYASSPELTMALCCYNRYTNEPGCHEKIDRYLDKALRDRLESIAVQRFYYAHNKGVPKNLNPAGAVRKLAALLDKRALKSLKTEVPKNRPTS